MTQSFPVFFNSAPSLLSSSSSAHPRCMFSCFLSRGAGRSSLPNPSTSGFPRRLVFDLRGSSGIFFRSPSISPRLERLFFEWLRFPGWRCRGLSRTRALLVISTPPHMELHPYFLATASAIVRADAVEIPQQGACDSFLFRGIQSSRIPYHFGFMKMYSQLCGHSAPTLHGSLSPFSIARDAG